MNNNKATAEQLQQFLSENPQWSLDKQKLHRTFVFQDFVSAFAFMSHIALIAERTNHHPEWSNTYKTVIVNLTTHEAKGISHKDFQLAQEMNRVANAMMSL